MWSTQHWYTPQKYSSPSAHVLQWSKYCCVQLTSVASHQKEFDWCGSEQSSILRTLLRSCLFKTESPLNRSCELEVWIIKVSSRSKPCFEWLFYRKLYFPLIFYLYKCCTYLLGFELLVQIEQLYSIICFAISNPGRSWMKLWEDGVSDDWYVFSNV